MTLLPLFPLRTADLVGPLSGCGVCRFCGFGAAGWMCSVRQGDEIVSCCLLCSLCRGLDRPRIVEEVAPIWLPEMTQRALVAVVRRLHLICHQHGQPPTMASVPPPGEPILSQAWGLYMALRRRVTLATARLGTSDLPELAEAIGDAERTGADVPSLLGGLRLLPLGRFFDGEDTDIYPQALAFLATSPTGAAA